jgi:hypothetical protein
MTAERTKLLDYDITGTDVEKFFTATSENPRFINGLWFFQAKDKASYGIDGKEMMDVYKRLAQEKHTRVEGVTIYPNFRESPLYVTIFVKVDAKEKNKLYDDVPSVARGFKVADIIMNLPMEMRHVDLLFHEMELGAIAYPC